MKQQLRIRAMGIGLVALGAFSLVRSHESLPQASKMGPGMKGPAHDHVKLPVPRTLDLAHVQPEHYAVALGKDAQRIFDFVRDHVAFEAYPGCLRGPRGTLLAMAGNSLDRAALVAGLLEKSGHKVRFVRGTLAAADAREMVLSMEADRPLDKPPPATDPAVKQAAEALVTSVKRDYQTIRGHLDKMKRPESSADLRMEDMVKEAQQHFWVQWQKDGSWTDVDPSFADSTLGRAHAKAEQTLDALPDGLFHWIELRIRLEEYPILAEGEAATAPKSRVILSQKLKAADLAGADIVLTHQPENWQGPFVNLTSALASTITNTGSVKPVLMRLTGESVSGDAFSPKLPSGKGLGGVGTLLGGAGKRNPVPVATAEVLELEFHSPGGRKQAVMREIFDVVGTARRAQGKNLQASEVRKRTADPAAVDPVQMVLSLLFTTGNVRQRLDAPELPSPAKGAPPDVGAILHHTSLTLMAAIDDVGATLRKLDRAIPHAYPDSPRVTIAEFGYRRGKARLALDLRHTPVRMVASTAGPQELFHAQVARGVVEGALEHALASALAEAANPGQAEAVLSTCQIFRDARAQNVPILFLSDAKQPLPSKTPTDVAALIGAELKAGNWLVIPEKTLPLMKENRLAWWRIDPRSGRTVAVTDEGLHGTTSEKNTAQAVVTRNTIGGSRVYTVQFRLGLKRWATEAHSARQLYNQINNFRNAANFGGYQMLPLLGGL